MGFIVLILSLLIERFLHVDTFFKRFNWFKPYLQLMQKSTSKIGMEKGLLGLILICLPILIAVAIVYYLLAGILWGLLGLILAVVILVYCLGPRDLYGAFEAYFIAVVRDDKEKRGEALNNLLCIIPDKPEDEARELTKTSFCWFNSSIFTVIFWFVILGPLAAVLYRCIAEVFKYAHCKDSQFSDLLEASSFCLKIIEWIPIRVMGLIMSLAGDFHHCFSYWLKNVFSSWQFNREFLQESGLLALGITDEQKGSKDLAEIKSALHLIDRTLIIFLVILALFIIGAIVF